MTLKERVENIKNSNIYVLKYQGETVGYRVSVFEPNEEVFRHYDFGVDLLEDFDVVAHKRLKGYEPNMPVINCVAQGTTCISEAELRGEITVKEFKDEANAVAVLTPVLNLRGA